MLEDKNSDETEIGETLIKMQGTGSKKSNPARRMTFITLRWFTGGEGSLGGLGS